MEDTLKERFEQYANNLVPAFMIPVVVSAMQSSYNLALSERWVDVSAIMPPFDTLVLLRGVISWKSKNSVFYFSDIVKNDYEILEYGMSGYLLENNSDYLVVNHPNPEEVCSEYITHWMPLPTPPQTKE